jgi:1,3-beta-galactosyl-N-acetylhexosamine phosphorylase
MRLFPYFFPDVFKPGGDPTGISRGNWVKIRRALLRKSVDRIGYGGYLSLILPFPGFVDHVEALCGEFREILSNTRKTPPYSAGFKVVVLNAWGRSRSWIQPILWPSKFPRSDVMESLAGMRFDVAFMSFDELSATGVPDDVGVVVNLGDAGTAWSGGRHWGDSRVVAALRRFVHAGGGFVGVSAPTAHEWQGRCFQLSDVLGVQKETGLSQTSAPCAAETVARHYILEDLDGAPDLGPYRTTHVYASDEATEVLMRHEGHVLLAAHRFGRGRSVYLAGLPYSHNNTRLLDRILFWAAGREEAQRCWSSSNPGTECAFYPETNRLVVVNNTGDEQRTTIMGDCGRSREISLQPYQCIWMTGA